MRSLVRCGIHCSSQRNRTLCCACLTELQSLLLRLSILVATSLSTLTESLPPNILAKGQEEQTLPSSHPVSNEAAAKRRSELTAQIGNDLRLLFTAAQKSCTYLTLALRPEKQQQHLSDSSTPSSVALSPVAGLHDSSIDAASAQLASITNESIPKLVWLSRKAASEATLHQYVAKTADDVAKDEAERAFVKAKGGQVIDSAHTREGEKLVKLPNAGLGKAWAKGIALAILELLEALGNLSRAFMNERTRNVLHKASAARDKAEGREAPQSGASTVQMPSTREAVRQEALQATAVVWEVCNGVLKSDSRLFKDNRTANQHAWRRRTETLQDALHEFQEALADDGDAGDTDDDEDADADNPLAGFGSVTLSDEDKVQASRYLALLKSVCQLHSKVGMHYLGAQATAGHEGPDLDDLNEAGEALADAVDELTAALLYGNDLPAAGSSQEKGNDGSKEEEREGHDVFDDEDNEVDDALHSLMDAVKHLHQVADLGTDSALKSVLVEQMRNIAQAREQLMAAS